MIESVAFFLRDHHLLLNLFIEAGLEIHADRDKGFFIHFMPMVAERAEESKINLYKNSMKNKNIEQIYKICTIIEEFVLIQEVKAIFVVE